MKEHRKLVIIDGYGLLFRAFYALPDLSTRSKVPIGGIYGTLRNMMQLINKYPGANLVVCLDGGGKTIRQQQYEAYKANRGDAPEDLVPQFDIFDEMIDALGLFGVRIQGYEADDIIATYARICAESKMQAVVVSSDKDLLQLINTEVSYYNPHLKRRMKEDDIIKKFGVKPSQLLHYLSFVGDTVDNIPGAKFIGPKTAADLISKYHTVEGVYQNIESIQNKRIKLLLKESQNDVIISKELVRLVDDIPNVPSINELSNKTLDVEKLQHFLNKYDIQSNSFNGLHRLINANPKESRRQEPDKKAGFSTSISSISNTNKAKNKQEGFNF